MSRLGSAIARHKGRTVAAGIAAIAVLGAAIYWFGPQKLFIDERVDETLPGLEAPASRSALGQVNDDKPDDDDDEPAGPVVLAQGNFRSLAHESSGRALVVELPDGSRLLRLEDLDVSNGPDLRVYLSTAPGDATEAAFGEDFVDLGGLKGNQGDQNYPIASDVDVARYRSAVVWCKRFSVGFGAAGLEPVRAR
ncbi:MAG: DM13 domain-containing protein [Actinomycetota bacterium]